MVFGSVLNDKLTMRAINHDGSLLVLLDKRSLRSLHTLLVVVGALVSTTEDDETVFVTLGTGNGSETLLRHTHEVVAGSSGANGVNGDAEVTVGAVLETDGERKTRGQLAVKLRLGGAGTDGADGDEVSEELGGDGVEHLAGNGHARGREVLEELPGDPEALVDLEGLVDIRVVDEALPADGGAGLLEVGTHDDDEVLGELGGDGL